MAFRGATELNLIERAALTLAVVGLFVLSLIYFFGHVVQPVMPTSWDYKDVVTILLSIVTVGLTMLVILVAVATLWGYQQISDHAGKRGEEASVKSAKEYLGSEDFRNDLRDAISEHRKNEAQDQFGAGLVAPPRGHLWVRRRPRRNGKMIDSIDPTARAILQRFQVAAPSL